MNQETLNDILQRNISLFEGCGVAYQQWQHEPILDFTTDEEVGKRLGWTATPTKSLFLKFKSGEHALLLTHKEARLDSKKIKAAVGKRSSIASDDEMIREIGCVPGAVCPFGIPTSIPLLIDEALFGFESLMYTPGPPNYTFAFSAKDLPVLLSALANPIHILRETIAQ
ncbi:YbaK/EbsC family protein [Enterovibrio sp. ZSDZ42]|uniref:YbaK/EbsC family protein n=1 Tax=Enterovibrio gelatinilyticus TaxID=2899819 RepID=A0ABT5QWE6_9GAMM|nr:YbaK/EbsC family protein [Enterovibrio sp. ZSDZ42]MDD1791846.1 YbaK/EbsC family protein [Enterovibrio sp. ZSDZ42]